MTNAREPTGSHRGPFPEEARLRILDVLEVMRAQRREAEEWRRGLALELLELIERNQQGREARLPIDVRARILESEAATLNEMLKTGKLPSSTDRGDAWTRYLLDLPAELHFAAVRAAFATDSPDLETVTTRLRRLRDDSREDGRRAALGETLARLLTLRFADLPSEARAKILAAHASSLERWIERVLTEPSIEAVLTAEMEADAADPG